jgi:hypothetical protein
MEVEYLFDPAVYHGPRYICRVEFLTLTMLLFHSCCVTSRS